MNRVWWGVVVDPPDGSGRGLVSFGDATRAAIFDPLIWGAQGGYPVPSPGDRVVVVTGWPDWIAIRPLGAGVPAGVPGLNWS